MELRQGLAAITRDLAEHQLPPAYALIRLDGLYGTGAVLSDVAGFAFVTRGRKGSLLDHPLVQARLHLPPDQVQQRPESHTNVHSDVQHAGGSSCEPSPQPLYQMAHWYQTVRSLSDCPEMPVGPEGVPCRVVGATYLADQNRKKKKKTIGVTRAGVVYELFFTNLPQQGFTARDVVELSLHRGAFEPVLADEDQEIDPDRWCSHSAWGQEGRATDRPMGVEPPPGTRTSASS